MVRKNGEETSIEVYDDFAAGLLGLEGFSHIFVFYWFDQNDTPEKRKTLRVHPRKDPRNPLTFRCLGLGLVIIVKAADVSLSLEQRQVARTIAPRWSRRP